MIKELSAATLRSIALNYIERKGPKPPKTLVKSIRQLKKRDDIVITKPDRGSGVVVMDKTDYIRLLSETFINDRTKFKTVEQQRPNMRGRPPKYYHPLFLKEKHLESVARRILPKEIADSICHKGSRLAHLYGLPKTHKERLAMRPRCVFSQVNTLSFSILFQNSWSISRVFVISLNQSSRHFLCASSFVAGNSQIPIPFVLLQLPQPNTAQLSPGMTTNEQYSYNTYRIETNLS